MSGAAPFDVIISGGGLVGRLLALALARAGFRIGLVDRAQAGEAGARDDRTTALAYASVRVFERLGVWEPLAAEAGIIRDILVTDGVPADHFRAGGVASASLHFPATLIGTEREAGGAAALGYIVPNRIMAATLDDSLAAEAGITRFHGQDVAHIAPGPSQIGVTLGDGRQLLGRLLVVADGKASPLSRQLGIHQHQWGYDQSALVFNVTHAGAHHGVAHELFFPAGPFAILPLPGDASSIVWTETTARAPLLLRLPKAAFLEAIRDRIGDLLGELIDYTPPQLWPLRLSFAPDPVGPRAVLIGDAAHAIHPIAGQGFNLGVKDVAALTDVLTQQAQSGLDIGDGAGLARYARWRRFDTASLALGTDVLNRLFSNDLAPLRLARRMGLAAVDRLVPLRRLFVQQAGADLGDLPALMRP